MKSNKLNRRTVLLGITVLIIIVCVLCVCFNKTLSTNSKISIGGILLSGLFGSIFSTICFVDSVSKNTTELQMQNQLKLRDMFAEEKRWEIHVWLFTGNEKEIASHQMELNDYLGLFEIAYKMLKNNTIDSEMFFTSYSYRISRIKQSDAVSKIINQGSDCVYWKYLNELIEKNDAWIASYKTKTEESK